MTILYFDNAATSFFKPRAVYRAVMDAMINHGANAGRGGYGEAIYSNELLFSARAAVADLFHIENPAQIAFTQNTTHALNLAIKGTLTYGDHVIYSSMEHNSVVRPITSLARQKRITTSVLRADKNGVLDVEQLPRLISRNTKLICLTHSSNVCGTISDIYRAQEIAREHGVLLLVDAAQSAGVLDIDASKLDLLAFPGHKGLMGPSGTGGLYVREGLDLATIIEGGTGSLSEDLSQPAMMPDRLESGTLNVPAISGLCAAVSFIKEAGVSNIRAHEDSLCRYFEERVREMKHVTVYGDANKTAICALNFNGLDCVSAAEFLFEKYGIAVRSGLHCAILAHKTLGTEKTGAVRFSFGFFNTLQETKRAVDAVYALSKEIGK